MVEYLQTLDAPAGDEDAAKRPLSSSFFLRLICLAVSRRCDGGGHKVLNRATLAARFGGPNPGEKGERAGFVEGEPDGRPRTVRQDFIFGEAGERDDASALDAEPAPPMGRGDVCARWPLRANCGDGMPQRAIVSSRAPSSALRTIGAE